MRISKAYFPNIPPVTIPEGSGSKKFVQPGRQLLGASRRGQPLFCARSVWIIRDHRKLARTRLTAFLTDPFEEIDVHLDEILPNAGRSRF